MKLFLISLFMITLILSCSNQQQGDSNNIKNEKKMSSISEEAVKTLIKKMIESNGSENSFRIERGIKQAASFWTAEDGSPEDFNKFCTENFIADSLKLDMFFNRLSNNLEWLVGSYVDLGLEFRRPVDLDRGEIAPYDRIFASYDISAHMFDDFFKNKLAFIVLLNFPNFTLEEKTKLGQNWSSREWAYARVGDIFTSRIPAELKQKATEAQANADAYISEYNIYVGLMKDNEGKSYFSKDMKLISHWNLRDEIKSQYSKPDGLPAQGIIYEAMKRIITQEIPVEVINSDKFEWNPYQNKVSSAGKEIKATPEPNTRYTQIINNFKALREIDPYSPYYPNYIDRKFNQEFEIPQKDVEQLFVEFISSPQVKQVAELISKRLNRKLEPWDIWYDGFKARSSISQDELTKQTRSKYPNASAFGKDIPLVLKKVGFTPDRAEFISSKISVEGSRGAGHASGAEKRNSNSYLRTRIESDGMNYKGYNIAVHELGHNVEQTISLHDVDYYMLHGVPNTAFTEAWAFIFQKRDLELLGITDKNPDKKHLLALDNFWATYEIMGVSLVDMRLWKWLYANPDATAEELKKETIKIANEVWNSYFAPIFGIKDQPILAIYSHMIDYPLYLSAYPIGHVIEFQIEEQIEGKNLGNEMQRILSQGRLIPQLWMKKAVGSELSIKPTLNATQTAIDYFKQKV